MDSRIRVLVIDDEAAIRRFLHASIDETQFEFLEAADGAAGIRAVATQNPDVVLLDLGLPDMDGVQVARSIREWSRVPIIVLSARGQERDKVEALDAGADDYLTKPFGVGELHARMRVALRHSAKDAPAEPSIEAQGIKIDFASRRVFRGSEEVHLTPNEYKLLALLARHPGKVLTHRQLLLEVWGPQYESESHYVRVYMGQLRHKLEADPSNPRVLTTEPGVGYRFRTE